ncbi:MAG: hypothetical protein A2406_04460 [Candidatus Komeilibacteria bacterium RIFOXYC1_FULL_37_11]|uniref:Uncharacterized protein n=1 Tax=Candidatus Komeilibacteria bacterium RIFOXYC1_FULL_37_11 TaxID=1798555 RepID=A0A1G2BZ36_9BACT|nr:MAG: hypothetical protein A2406_04460 [Candidatus Komeilibacteria bacterium RIFOXYC1_FULL_37_11]OGY95743.1 MAG: hypothetical protein A2611_03105 [Candidatus Komeilibacteria bacterium RIFOXYD1_FULL_37_29]
MDAKRKKILLILAVLVVLIILFLIWILKTSDQGPMGNENTNTPPPVFKAPSVNLEYKDSVEVKQTSTEFSVINLAKTYAARFGSWSTDNQGANLNELLPLSTEKMRQYIASIDLDFSPQEFRGNTTKSISAKIISLDENSAEVLVNTQKIETKANLEESVYYQEATVKMIKSGDVWLVDEFIWQ